MEQEKDMASLKDISKICGVSVATVSKALNDHKDIGEETKATIRCIPFETFLDDDKEPGTCMVTGKPSACRALFARSY